jgi:hypothetical protein
MQCYECSLAGRQVPSTVICTNCGVAACSAHSRVVSVPVRSGAVLGPAAVTTSARRATCESCHGAGVATRW